MFFVLTGDVQTGKTRWLEKLVHDLKRGGITPHGVIAPGIWADRRNEAVRSSFVDANGFEKLGIDNILLPGEERIAFARRADLAETDGSSDQLSQSAQANLGWAIDEAAISRVNAHFAQLTDRLAASKAPGFLVVDELGRLELERDGGLTEAVSLLEKGPFPTTPHALIVVRQALLPSLTDRFTAWGEHLLVAPDEASRACILEAIGVQTSAF